jgi:hypothetical protein
MSTNAEPFFPRAWQRRMRPVTVPQSWEDLTQVALVYLPTGEIITSEAINARVKQDTPKLTLVREAPKREEPVKIESKSLPLRMPAW